ncbi:hypothetical protein BHE74_00044376 [Ensete ventricosum]|uniref:Uncharacterized protein n=1 Tax=Ensete ventricosum TaxID=4639 RepID=A0A445MLZ4_ENSVE|nr:hypothetical protein BHE74_00044376 [Ensete ventricosum]RZR75275.1 hypothetical protein BHM03_00053495 [Ensete ventricosum]
MGWTHFCMVSKMKGASMHMLLILEKHLIEGLRRLNLQRILSASTSESHGGLDHTEVFKAAVEFDCFSAHIRLREPDKSEDKAE